MIKAHFISKAKNTLLPKDKQQKVLTYFFLSKSLISVSNTSSLDGLAGGAGVFSSSVSNVSFILL
jgi:hypothetical protein